MKKFIIIASIIIIIIIAVVIGTIVINNNKNNGQLNKDMVYEGVNNYCKSNYNLDESANESSGTYVQMGDETETEYKVIFRSYTGTFVYFYVNKSNGSTRMIENMPSLNVENEIGTINIFDYINK